jgi:hypothetical protein
MRLNEARKINNRMRVGFMDLFFIFSGVLVNTFKHDTIAKCSK